MKILYLSSYKAWDAIRNDSLAKHHLFGMHEYLDSNHADVDFYCLEAGKKISKPFVRLRKVFRMLKHMAALLTVFSKYDLVYDTHFQVTYFYGFMKRLGFYKNTKLVAIMHRPLYFRYALAIGGADAYIFFVKEHYDYALQLKPTMKSRLFLNRWCPDTERYKKFREQHEPLDTEIFFIDNGKTQRDHELLIAACAKTNIPTIMPEGTTSGTNVPNCLSFYKTDYSTENEILMRLISCKAIIIPIKKTSGINVGGGEPLITPFGLTSLMDAIALNIPVICSDNFVDAAVVKKYEIGLVYETASLESLTEKMRLLYSDKNLYARLVRNMKQYSESNTLEKYRQCLIEILGKIGCDIKSHQDIVS